MKYLIQAIIGSIFGVGLFLILADCFRVPFLSTSKAANSLAKRQRKKTNAVEIWLKDLAAWIGKHLRLDEYKRMQLQADLQSAGIAISPEMHIADSIVKSLLVGILAVPVFFIFPLLTPLVIALAAATYFKSSKGVADKLKEKRRKIEYERRRVPKQKRSKTGRRQVGKSPASHRPVGQAAARPTAKTSGKQAPEARAGTRLCMSTPRKAETTRLMTA